ncbi:MAG: protease SohB, partial [Pseudomonadaceae bacterium]
DDVATGEVWLGTAALGKHLADEIKTSDQYLAERAHEAELFHLHYAQKKSLPERFGMAASALIEHGVAKGWKQINEQKFWR